MLMQIVSGRVVSASLRLSFLRLIGLAQMHKVSVTLEMQRLTCVDDMMSTTTPSNGCHFADYLLCQR